MSQPVIYVLARPSFSDNFARFLQDEGEVWDTDADRPAERLVEFAGRMCYMSFGVRQSPRNNRQYIENLIYQGHESVLEHVCWTFLLAGVTRGFTHQLVRHRIGFSFSQLSQQYHDESRAEFLMPEGLEEFPEAAAAWRQSTAESLNAYAIILSNLSKGGGSKEALRAIRTTARSVLPNATSTKIVVTANARAIRHFLALRGAIEGDLEMRRVSYLIYNMLLEDAPALLQDFVASTLEDGTPSISKVGLE